MIAAENGHLELLHWLSSIMDNWSQDFSIAAKVGWKQHISAVAAKCGHIEILKFMRSEDFNPYNYGEVWNGAASGGQLNIMQWMDQQKEDDTPREDRRAFKYAVEAGHRHIIEWLYYNEGEITEIACSVAAQKGDLSMLKWLRGFPEGGFPWNWKTTEYAVISGNLEMLEWGFENNIPRNERACLAAVKHNRLEILKWLIENNCPYNLQDLRIEAIKGNCLDTLEYLKSIGCTWNDTDLNYTENLQVAQWLIDFGCNFPKKFFDKSFNRGLVDLAKWAFENGCPWEDRLYVDYENVWLDAAIIGNLETLKWLASLEEPNYLVWEIIVSASLEKNRLQVVKWGLRHSQVCIDSLEGNLRNASENKQLLKWLERQLDDKDLQVLFI